MTKDGFSEIFWSVAKRQVVVVSETSINVVEEAMRGMWLAEQVMERVHQERLVQIICTHNKYTSMFSNFFRTLDENSI